MANLQIELARNGFAVSEILSTTDAVLDLSIATGEDLVNSGILLSSVIRGYNLDATESVKVTDILTQSFNVSALGLENYTEAIKIAGPAAKAANIDLETTTALLGKLADVGIKGSIAGTAIKQILAEVANPLSEMSKKFGLTVKNGDDLVNALVKIKNAGFDFADAVNMVGKEGTTGILAIVGQADKIDTLKSSLENSQGVAKATAQIMQKDLKGATDVLSSAWEGLMLDVGEGLSEFARKGAVGLTALIEGLQRLPKWLKENKYWIMAVAASLASLKWGKSISEIKSFIETMRLKYMIMMHDAKATLIMAQVNAGAVGEIGNMRKAVLLLNAAWKANPIGLIITGVTLLVAAGTALYNIFSDVNDETKIQGELMKELSDKTKEEALQADALIDVLKSQNTTQEQKNAAYDILLKKYPEILNKYGSEESVLNNINKVQKEINANIVQRAIEEVKASAIKKQLELELENEIKRKQAEGGDFSAFSFWDKMSAYAIKAQTFGDVTASQYLSAKAWADSEEGRKKLETTLKVLPNVQKEFTETLNNITANTNQIEEGNDAQIKKYNERIALLNSEMKNASAERKKYYQQKIQEEENLKQVYVNQVRKNAQSVISSGQSFGGSSTANDLESVDEKQKKLREKQIKEEYNNKKELLKLEIDVAKKLSAERQSKEKELVSLEFQERRRKYEESSTEYRLLKALEVEEMSKIDEEYSAKRQEQVDKLSEKEARLREQEQRTCTQSIGEDQTKLARDLQIKLNMLNVQMNAELQAVGNSEEAKERIREKYRKLNIEAQKEFYKKEVDYIDSLLIKSEVLSNELLSETEVEDLKLKLSDLQSKISDLNTEVKSIKSVESALGLTGKQKEMLMNGVSFIQTALTGISEVRRVNQENEIKQVQDNTEKEKEILKGKLDHKLITQASYDKQLAELEKEAAAREKEIAKEQFETNKKFQLLQAVINGAAAQLRILADVPKVDFGISTAILMAAAATETALQIAAISKTKFRKGTRLKGPTHENGGIQIYGQNGYYGEAEDDEIILTSGVAKNPYGLKIASDLNQMFGGIRFDNEGSIDTKNGNLLYNFPKFAKGTLLRSYSNSGGSIDYELLSDRIVRAMSGWAIELSLEATRNGIKKLDQYENNGKS